MRHMKGRGRGHGSRDPDSRGHGPGGHRGRGRADRRDESGGEAGPRGRGGRGWGGGPGGGRGGRVLAPGDLRPLMLSLVAEQPRYGYELMKAIEDMFGGAYAPSPGSVYPTLTMLEETGLLKGREDDTGRRRYEVTAAGKTYLADNADAVSGVRRRVELAGRIIAGRRPPEAIFQSMQMLKTALGMHSGDWTDDEAARVSAIIEDAAARINERPRGAKD